MAQGRPVLIVTGGGRGIGAAVAWLAGARGYDVAINYLLDRIAAEKMVDDVRGKGGSALSVVADVSREEDVLRLFETVTRELGPVGALVNSAGETGGFARVEDVTVETIAHVLAVNVIGTFLCAREAVRRMSTKRGGKAERSSTSLRSPPASAERTSGSTTPRRKERSRPSREASRARWRRKASA
jgi:NAD(P)-dependent dehydrogenase (short-subunit alcohol dehydrogenase family)